MRRALLQIPPSEALLQVDFLTAHLATAHIPLALMVFGLNADLDLPHGRQASSKTNLPRPCNRGKAPISQAEGLSQVQQGRHGASLLPHVQAADPVNSLALRLLIPLAAAAVAALALPQRYTDAIAIASLCAVGPLSEQVRSRRLAPSPKAVESC